MSNQLKRVISIILFVFIILCIGVAFLFHQLSKSIVNSEVADYETRIEIWNTVAGNRSQSKLEVMHIDSKQTNILQATINFANAIVGTEYEDAEMLVDTFT